MSSRGDIAHGPISGLIGRGEAARCSDLGKRDVGEATVRGMWRIFRQWMLVRWVDKELLRHEEDQRMVNFGDAMLLSVAHVVPEYRSHWWVRASDVKVRRLLDLCVEDGYFATQEIQESGLSIKVTPSKGGGFVPVFSGLILAELAYLHPLWAACGGGVFVGLLWVLHSVVHLF